MGKFNEITAIVKGTKKYKNNFRYWPLVYYHMATGKYPFWATTRDGRKVRIHGINELFLLMAQVHDYEYNEGEKTLILNFLGKNLYFYGTERNGDIPSVFFGRDYDSLDVKGKDVLDIGANIGDSTVFFCVKGARRVIAVEPFENSFNFCEKNVKANGCDKVVKVLNVGIGSMTGSISIPTDQDFSTIDNLMKNRKDTERSTMVPVYSLQSILYQEKIEDGVLKMDCEGCEYDVILSSKIETLRKIEEYSIEYHYDPFPLIKKLKEAGFDVTFKSSGGPSYNRSTKTAMTTGIIYAKRSGD